MTPGIRSLQIRFRAWRGAFLLGPNTTPLEADDFFLVAGFVRFFVAFEKGKRMRKSERCTKLGLLHLG